MNPSRKRYVSELLDIISVGAGAPRVRYIDVWMRNLCGLWCTWSQASTGSPSPSGISAVLASEPAGTPLRGFLKHEGIPAGHIQILRGSKKKESVVTRDLFLHI